jgi:ATP-dependent Clp protease ATP-binding subunit ClpB
MDKILEIQLRRLNKLLAARELTMTITPEARTKVCDLGYDPAFGARPLKRVITSHMMNPMSKALLSGGFDAGDTIAIDLVDDRLNFTRVPAEAAPAAK